MAYWKLKLCYFLLYFVSSCLFVRLSVLCVIIQYIHVFVNSACITYIFKRKGMSHSTLQHLYNRTKVSHSSTAGVFTCFRPYVAYRPVSSTTPTLLLWGSHSSAPTLWLRTSVSSARLVVCFFYWSPLGLENVNIGPLPFFLVSLKREVKAHSLKENTCEMAPVESKRNLFIKCCQNSVKYFFSDRR